MKLPPSPLVSTAWLSENLHSPDLVIADVRNVTNQPQRGKQIFGESHIPGAIFLDMDSELADRSDLTRGRHPLPKPEVFVLTLAKHGIGSSSFVVAYDNGPGSNAARLWWMMKWIGSDRAAVLDGGLTKWCAENREIESGEAHPRQAVSDLFSGKSNDALTVSMQDVEHAEGRGLLLLDARAGERFRGEVEVIDKRAGHIPGAVNLPWADLVTGDETPVLKSPAVLRELFLSKGVSQSSKVVTYCGSGVTAALNTLALEVAGFPVGRLYPGSWSEWLEHH